jgi:ABC-type glycerol-3-phosphate transport system permease component
MALLIKRSTAPEVVLRRRRAWATETARDKGTLTLIYIGLSICAVVILFPLLYILAASFSSGTAVINSRVWLWPVGLTLVAYKEVFQYPGFWQSYLNSVIYTVAGTVLSVSLSVMLGWPLSRNTFWGRRFLSFAVLFAFLVSGGIVPLYLVVQELGMINTRWSQIVPSALSVFSVILARSFFRTTIPDALVEAAEIDGASDLQVLRRIVLPMSKPVLAVLALIFAVAQWNSYFYALVFLNSQSLYPLQMVLREVLVLNQLSPSDIANLSAQQLANFATISTLIKYALIVVGSLPMLVLYPFAQRYFVKGFRLGSLKE